MCERVESSARKHVSLMLRPPFLFYPYERRRRRRANVYYKIKLAGEVQRRQYASQCARDYNQHTRCTERQLFLIGQKRRVIFLLVASKFAL
jgi:hypothetical protein